ncbi:glycosyl transferase [Moorella sp. E308F]|uniref:glycosyltransferase family 2 protein n=1 Tax=Moorella sp. E308F TaxID=2572682 RepID=UPI0010FFBA06|nr:glycosyltransferase family 2 protein [Moorella sp. E308F]GEA14645.1 glycosyl transferase [Moorella sp. E308F]
MRDPEVSIIIVTYNSKRYLQRCLESIYRQTSFSYEVIIVDNCSIDDTVEYVQNNFPSVRVIRNTQNKGYGAGNNLGVKYARGKFIVILNPDTVVENNWLYEIIKPLETGDRLITIPKVLLYDGSRINTCGLNIHFTGLAFLIGFGKKSNEYNDIMEVYGIAGCCFAMQKKYYQDLGGFDERIFMYQDDVDFSINARLSGFKILFVPKAIIRHDYTLKVDNNKIYLLEKGRYLILKKYYKPLNIMLMMPSIIMSEILTLGYSLKFGLKGVYKKYKGLYDVLKIKDSSRKKVNDIGMFSNLLPTENQLQSKVINVCISLVNAVFYLNSLVYRILKLTY